MTRNLLLLLLTLGLLASGCGESAEAPSEGVSTPGRSSEPEAKRESAGVASQKPGIGLGELDARIAALEPSQAVSGGTRFLAASILGYDLSAPLRPDGIPRVMAGETYPLVVYLVPKVPGELDLDVVTKLGNMFIARVRANLSDADLGEVIKKEISVRIPLTCPVGEHTIFLSLLEIDSPSLVVFACGGTVEVENRRTPLATPVQRPSATCTVRGNMIPNPSFEDLSRRSDWVLDKEKKKRAFGFSVAIDNAEAYTGMHSLMVDFHGGVDTDVWEVKGVEVPVVPGEEYEFGFYYKTKDLPPVPQGMRGPCMQILDADDKNVRIVLLDLAKPVAPTEWTRREWTFTVPQGTNKIRIRTRRYGSVDRRRDWANVKMYPAGGTVWIDCMWLVPGS